MPVHSRPAALVRPPIFDNSGRRGGRRGRSVHGEPPRLTITGSPYKWAARNCRCPPTRIGVFLDLGLDLWIGCADYAVDAAWLERMAVAR